MREPGNPAGNGRPHGIEDALLNGHGPERSGPRQPRKKVFPRRGLSGQPPASTPARLVVGPQTEVTTSAQGQQGAGRPSCSLTRKNPSTLSDHDAARPQPGDLAHLKVGNRIGAGPDDLFVIVDDVPPRGERLILNRSGGHPDRYDWAAALVLADVATLTRIIPEGTRTWVPPHVPEATS
ncbi:DUF6211 family protein [Streptomyces sp. Ac-502]|uniref:DUF6211 family protein n=1 Tax=Streptomyces sp. Ac-502 TaxID=3342801 RepID=UPI003862A3DD